MSVESLVEDEAKVLLERLIHEAAELSAEPIWDFPHYKPRTKVVGKDGVAYLVHKNIREQDTRLFLDRVDGERGNGLHSWNDAARYKDDLAFVLGRLEDRRLNLRKWLTKVEHWQDNIITIAKMIEVKMEAL